MKIGFGIAVAGIWIGVGLSAFGAKEACMIVGACAMIATGLIAFFQ